MIEFGEGFRSRWMLEDRIAYLNHAGFGATPTAVLQAADEWRHKMEAEPVRFMEEELLPALDETARRLARFVGAKPSDLAFVDNATTGMNAVLQSLELAAGDEIVTTDHAYQAIKRTLDFVSAQRRANLKIAQIAYPVRDRVAILEAIETQFSERTRYLVIDHITSHTALRMPLREILSLAQARDIPVLVDGAHAPGNLALNLEDLSAAGLTWYVGNCHKWLCGAKSAGFLWADPKHQRTIVPPVIGNFFGDGYREAFSWPGTRDFSPWLAVSAALDFQAEIGAEKIRTYCHGLADEGAALLVRRHLKPQKRFIGDCDTNSMWRYWWCRLRADCGRVFPRTYIMTLVTMRAWRTRSTALPSESGAPISG